MIDYIDIDVWQNSIVFMVEPTLQEFDRFYYDNTRRMSDDDYKAMRDDIEDPNSCMGFTITVYDGGLIIYLRDPYTFLYSAHEIFHAVNKMLLKRGVHLDEDGEPWAYTIGLVTNWYVKWLCRERKLLMFVPVDMVKPEYLKQINYKE
jgi:hypothetical protein